ncbi:uncharacterized protein LOC113797185 [Dermatophagoides pteronyssinus]|uniref:uncharacterized protein LOC113797185 n=1 Tax=Dermatophagoides pteronyssinus TaxID=6956 RepID=UPI003F6688D7
MGSTTAVKESKDGIKDRKRSRSSSRSSGSSRSRSRSSSASSRSSSSGSSSRSSSSRSASSRSSHSSSSKSSGYRRRYHRDRGDSPRDRRGAPPPASLKKRGPSPIPPSASFTRLYIGRLTRNVNRDHLHEIFSAFGKVINVDLPMDRMHSHLNRGFAYVEFENPDDAVKAVKYMDGGQIDGQEISAAKIDLQKVRGHIPQANRGGGGGRNPGWRPNSPPNRIRRRSPPPPHPSRRRTRSRSRTPPPPVRDNRRRRSSRSSSASSR